MLLPTPPELTTWERDVLLLLVESPGNKVIAQRLGIAPDPVKDHLDVLPIRLTAHDRHHVVLRARELGLVPALAHPLTERREALAEAGTAQRAFNCCRCLTPVSLKPNSRVTRYAQHNNVASEVQVVLVTEGGAERLQEQTWISYRREQNKDLPWNDQNLILYRSDLSWSMNCVIRNPGGVLGGFCAIVEVFAIGSGGRWPRRASCRASCSKSTLIPRRR